jgi:hypothetical protein
MFTLFHAAVAWIARQFFPPPGRHRQRSIRQRPLAAPLTSLAARPFANPPARVLRRQQLPPSDFRIRAGETALVRPYVLAAEQRLMAAAQLL